jgi:Fe-S cluster assembly protein SufD
MTDIIIDKAGLETVLVDQPGEYHVKLMAEGAEVEIKGAFKVANDDIVNVTVIIHHLAKHTRANTTLRGIVRDKAQVCFRGRIIIEENCGDSHSFLTERILLLSNQAKAEAVPDLEIKTDDVKCSHAASISRIPEAHLFYLQARGLSRTVAEDLITDGFLDLSAV